MEERWRDRRPPVGHGPWRDAPNRRATPFRDLGASESGFFLHAVAAPEDNREGVAKGVRHAVEQWEAVPGSGDCDSWADRLARPDLVQSAGSRPRAAHCAAR